MLSHRDMALLVLRIPLTALFVALLLWYARYESKQKVSFRKHWGWLAGALAAEIIASLIFAFSSGKTGDLMLHVIGGGTMCTLIFIYTEKTFGLKFSWHLELILLFAFVSSLGVLNELAEYALELLKVGIMSPDTHDTWRDLTANTFGAVGAWAFYRILFRERSARRPASNLREKL